MKKFILFLFIFISSLSFVGCKQKENLSTLSKNFSTYQISINFNEQEKSATCEEYLNYKNNTNSILKVIKFHIYPQFYKKDFTSYLIASTNLNSAYPNGMSYAVFNILRVTDNTDDLNYFFEGVCEDILCVELQNSLLPNNTTNISISFSFTLPNCEHRFGYGESTINIANFYPIVCAFENGEFSTNPYCQNGDPFFSDIANYCVDITVPNEYVVASTGINENTETQPNSTKTLKFNATMVRDFALVLSKKFQVVSTQINHTKVEYYFYDDKNPNQNLQAGADAISTFSKMFGDYPYKTFTIAKADFIYGGMEYPNLVLISDDIEDADDFKNVIIHETAHQWWYNVVGNDEFSFPWLDEALTEYSTILFYDNCKGYAFNHKQMVDANKSNYTLFVDVYTDVLGNLDTSMRAVNQYNTEPEYTYCTYVKGVLMYESLYNLIGEKNFLKGLKKYYEANKFTNTEPGDLISAFQLTSNKELSSFFDSWLSGKVIIR